MGNRVENIFVYSTDTSLRNPGSINSDHFTKHSTLKLLFIEPGLIGTHFQNHFYLEGKAGSCDHSGEASYLIGYSVNSDRQRRGACLFGKLERNFLCLDNHDLLTLSIIL